MPRPPIDRFITYTRRTEALLVGHRAALGSHNHMGAVYPLVLQDPLLPCTYIYRHIYIYVCIYTYMEGFSLLSTRDGGVYLSFCSWAIVGRFPTEQSEACARSEATRFMTANYA